MLLHTFMISSAAFISHDETRDGHTDGKGSFSTLRLEHDKFKRNQRGEMELKIKNNESIARAAVVEGPPAALTNFESTRPVLLSYDEIPEWHQDNDFIRHGYRPESNSTQGCFASWLYLHNETVNIHSHLIPGVLFLVGQGAIYQYLRTRYHMATIGDHLIFAFFLLTAATCLGMSATYHTLMNHSIDVSHLWLRLDFVGIIVLTLRDFVSRIYMVFYCELDLQRIYWAMVHMIDHLCLAR